MAEKVVNTVSNNDYVSVKASLCTRFRVSRSDCSKCADSCPVGAINIPEKCPEIGNECNGCGVCFSACPNGVFKIKERDDIEIINEIRKRGKNRESGVFRISCERGDTSADMVLSCLGRLTEILLLELVQTGASGIEILKPFCAGCSYEKGIFHLNKTVRQTVNIYNMLSVGRNYLYIKEISFQKQKNRSEKSVSRRDFFEAIKKNVIGMASSSIPDFENSKEKEEEFRNEILKKEENQKRNLLLASLKGFNFELQNVNTIHTSSDDSLFAEIEINTNCTACGVCAVLCPTGAINRHAGENYFVLSFKPHLCTNCNVCIKTCMPKAIQMKEEVLLNLLLEQKEVNLFERKKKVCSICRMDSIDTGTEICPLCKDRHEKQMALIEGLFNK